MVEIGILRSQTIKLVESSRRCVIWYRNHREITSESDPAIYVDVTNSDSAKARETEKSMLATVADKPVPGVGRRKKASRSDGVNYSTAIGFEL